MGAASKRAEARERAVRSGHQLCHSAQACARARRRGWSEAASAAKRDSDSSACLARTRICSVSASASASDRPNITMARMAGGAAATALALSCCDGGRGYVSGSARRRVACHVCACATAARCQAQGSRRRQPCAAQGVAARGVRRGVANAACVRFSLLLRRRTRVPSAAARGAAACAKPCSALAAYRDRPLSSSLPPDCARGMGVRRRSAHALRERLFARGANAPAGSRRRSWRCSTAPRWP